MIDILTEVSFYHKKYVPKGKETSIISILYLGIYRINEQEYREDELK